MSDRQGMLQESVLLLSPTLSYFRGSYQLSTKKTTVAVGGATVDARSVTTPHAVLLKENAPVDRAGQPWKKRLNAIEAQHTRTIERYSVPFPIRGVRIVPKTRGGQFFTELFGPTAGGLQREWKKVCDTVGAGCQEARQIRGRLDEALRQTGLDTLPDDLPMFDPAAETQSVAYQLHMAANEFCDDLQSIMQQIQQNTDPSVWEDVRLRIPLKRADMMEKFNLDVVPVEIAGSGQNSEKLTQADLTAHSDIIRAACQRKVDEAIEAMVAEPRGQLAAAIQGLQDLVGKGGRVTAKSFNPLQAAIDKIRAFAFVADDDLLAMIDRLEQQLGRTEAKHLTETNMIASGLSNLLTDVATSVSDANRWAEDVSRFGRARRAVRVPT